MLPCCSPAALGLLVGLSVPQQEPGTALSCRVTNADGEPIAGARARLIEVEPARGRRSAAVRDYELPGGQRGADADGVVRMAQRLDPEFTYGMLVVGPDGASACTVLQPGRRDGQLDLGTVALVAAMTPSERAAAPPPAPAPLSDGRARAIASTLLAPFVERALDHGDAAARLRGLQALAWADPKAALAQIDRAAFDEPFLGDAVRREIVAELVRRDPAEAFAVLPGFAGAASRAYALLAIAERTRDPALLDAAWLQARVSGEPQDRVALLARIADAWFGLGDDAKAARALATAAPIADRLPDEDWPAFARCRLAEQVGKLDLDRALAIIEPRSPRDRDRHHGNLAHELADRDPAAAERVLALVEWRSNWLTRVCHRMARVDPDRAVRLATAEDVPRAIQGYTLGLIALQFADTEPERAASLLDRAFDLVLREGRGEVAAALLPVVERVAPDRVRELAFAAIARGKPLSAASIGDRCESAERLAQLILPLCRYRPAEAAALAAPLWGELPLLLIGRRRGALIPALAVADPERCAAAVAALTESLGTSLTVANAARIAAARAIARRDPGRWDWLTDEYLGLWIVGKEDL
ncbi:MAG: hypothetical protein KDE27_23975 [Planctomycetes bacterium]|nr:hypothetical protein [Planctomycetota bacterium]